MDKSTVLSSLSQQNLYINCVYIFWQCMSSLTWVVWHDSCNIQMFYFIFDFVLKNVLKTCIFGANQICINVIFSVHYVREWLSSVSCQLYAIMCIYQVFFVSIMFMFLADKRIDPIISSVSYTVNIADSQLTAISYVYQLSVSVLLTDCFTLNNLITTWVTIM